MAEDCLGSLGELVHDLRLRGDVLARLIEDDLRQELSAETALRPSDPVQPVVEREPLKLAEVPQGFLLPAFQAPDLMLDDLSW